MSEGRQEGENFQCLLKDFFNAMEAWQEGQDEFGLYLEVKERECSSGII